MHSLLSDSRAPRILLAACLSVALIFVGCDSGGVMDDGDPGDGGPGDTNNEPVASFTTDPDPPFDTGTQVTLDASGSSDPDGDALSYEWQLNTPGSSSVTLSSTNGQQVTFTPDVEGSYTAELTVSDGNGGNDNTSQSLQAQAGNIVTVAGDIGTATTWTSDTIYRLTGTVRVDGANLTIEPGTRVEFEADAGLFIRGGSTLVADGTSTEPIVLTGTEQVAGHWLGVGFAPNGTTHTLDYVTVEYAGQAGTTFNNIDRPAAVALDRDVSVEITNATLQANETYGLYADQNTSLLPNFAANTFAGNGQGAAYLPSTLMTSLDTGSSYDDGDPATPSVVRIYEAGNFDTATVIPAIDAPYRINDGNILNARADFTIEAGTTMEFGAAAGLYVTPNGTLSINGTSSERVLLTGTEQTPGHWKGIGFDTSDNQNVITHTTIEYGGNENTHSGLNEPANLALEDNSVDLTNSTLRQSGKWGLYAEIGGSTLPNFGNNVLTDNTAAPMYIPPSLMYAPDASIDFANNGQPYVLVFDGETPRDGTVSPLANDYPYRINTVLRFNGAYTVADGVEMEFGAGAGLFFTAGSRFVVNGSSTDGVRMTSAAATPARGDWRGIAFGSNANTHDLTNLTISFAGGDDMSNVSGAGNLRMDASTSLRLTDCTITNSASYGVWRDSDSSSALIESGTTYSNNANGAQNNP